MKNFYPICLMVLFFNGIAHSQNPADTVIQIKEFPAEGLLLNSGWTFHPGDDTIYVRYNYNEKAAYL